MTRSRAAWALLVILLGRVPALDAQVEAIDVSRLAPGIDSMAILLERGGMGIPVGTLWDEVAVLREPGQPLLLRRVYRTVNRATGSHLDTTVTALPDLRLRYHRTIQGAVLDSLVATGDTLAGWLSDSTGGRRPFRRALPTGQVEMGLFDLLIRAAPWAPGLEVRAEAFIPAVDTTFELVARWAGEADVTLRSGEVAACWRIESEVAGLVVTSWVDRRTRVLTKGRIQLTPELAMVMLR
jgi:hypothetical protein